MNPHDLVRLSPTTMECYAAHMLQQKINDLTIQLMTLHDLIRQLDPDHMYVFNPEYQSFVKTRLTDENVEQDSNSTMMQGAVITRGVG